jgi:hypothetical protein
MMGERKAGGEGQGAGKQGDRRPEKGDRKG